MKPTRDLRRRPRPRAATQELIAGCARSGAKVNLITDGDVAPAIAAAQPATGVDLLMGIGGTPEGVIAAAARQVPRRRGPGPALAA